MKRRVLLIAITVLIAWAPMGRAAVGPVSVAVDRTTVATQLGNALVIRSTISNLASTPATGLVAHLNVVGIGRGLYVDPEDWSSDRTRYLPTIPAGGTRTLSWKLHAVSAGDLAVYIAVLPRTGAGTNPVTGPFVHVSVANRATLDAGGMLPLAIGIPVLLGLLTLATRSARRRPRPRAS
jgi:hypothetical protein